MKNFKVLVWDLDGTLYRSNEMALIMRDKIIDIIYKNSNKSKNSIIKLFTKKVHKGYSWSKTASILTGLSEWKILMLLEKKIDRTLFIKKNEKLLNLFKKLDNFRHFIITNSTHDNAIQSLKSLGFRHKKKKIINNEFANFEKIFSIDKTQKHKPNSNMFKLIMKFSGVRPEEHLMIGDMVNIDILPAKKLNFKTCLVWGYSPKADYCFNSVYDVENILSKRLIIIKSVKNLINTFFSKI